MPHVYRTQEDTHGWCYPLCQSPSCGSLDHEDISVDGVARQGGIADNRYDAESNHEFVQMFLGARTATPIRPADRPKIKMRGMRRRRQTK